MHQNASLRGLELLGDEAVAIARDSASAAAAIVQRVSDIAPIIEQQAAEAERIGHLTDEVVQLMRAAGIYTMLFPKAVGGAELLPLDALKIIELASYHHGSAGWCAMVNNMEGATMAIYLEDTGINEVFAKGPDLTIAGNGVPRGFARPVDGGYMIRGNWAYGSGIFHAEWIHSGCFVTGPNGEKERPPSHPEIIVTHHPRSSIKLQGNWNVLGLRATGSVDYTIENDGEHFVPSRRCYDFASKAPLRGRVQGNLGLPGYSAWSHTAWALGVGRRMLDELIKLVVGRTDVFGKSSDSATFKFQFAQAEAKFRAARALVYETWGNISLAAARGEPPTLEQMTLVKLCFRYIHDVASEVSTFAHRNARGASLHDTILQRCYRDIHAGTQHVTMADPVVEECGRALLGLARPDGVWTPFGIVD